MLVDTQTETTKVIFPNTQWLTNVWVFSSVLKQHLNSSRPPFKTIIFFLFACFFLFLVEKDKNTTEIEVKDDFKWHAKHPFVGKSTDHMDIYASIQCFHERSK